MDVFKELVFINHLFPVFLGRLRVWDEQAHASYEGLILFMCTLLDFSLDLFQLASVVVSLVITNVLCPWLSLAVRSRVDSHLPQIQNRGRPSL
jgi:hypothetical protein